MKKILFISLLILLGLAWGCSDDNITTESPNLNLSGTSLNFAINPDKANTITITSNVEWTAAVAPGCTWCTLSQQSGMGNATISVIAGGNTELESRKTTITITGRGLQPDTITVSQLGRTPEILIDEVLHNVNENDSVIQIKVVTNIGDIGVMIPEATNWVTLQSANISAGKSDMLVNLKIKRNPTFEARTATITIAGQKGNISQTITIEQKGQRIHTLKFINANFENGSLLTPIARKISFSVDANVEYTIKVEATGEWIKQFSHTNNNYVFNVDENSTLAERVGRIIVSQTGGTLADTLTIRQDIFSEIIKIVNPSFDEAKGIKAAAGQILFTVETNVNYAISVQTTAGNWIREASNSGGMYSFTVDANMAPNTRTALIIAKQVGGNVADTLTVTQDAVNRRYSDSLALMAIYHALDMGNWSKTSVNARNNRPWAFDLTKPMDEWGGIRLNKEGRVIRWQVFEDKKGGLHSNPNFRFNIPPEVAQLTELSLIQIVTYNFGSFPPEIGNLPKLDTLALSGDLTGTLPASLGNLTSLKYLLVSCVDTIGSCQLGGTLPATLGNLSKLEHMVINRTMIGGNIPASLGNLTKLRVLSLAVNKLEGAIPNGLGQLSDLESLLLFTNNLTGSIPAEFDNLKKIRFLMLGYNYLSGTVSEYLKNKNAVSPKYFDYCPQNGTGFSNFTCN